MYELEYLDGECASLSANHIAENLFTQVDNEGNQQVLMKEIIGYHTNGQEVKQQDAFITTRTGTKRRRETTKGWEILIEWKDGSMNWVTLRIISSSSDQIRHLQPYCRGTSICLVGPICHEEEKSHPGKSEVQILAHMTQVRD